MADHRRGVLNYLDDGFWLGDFRITKYTYS